MRLFPVVLVACASAMRSPPPEGPPPPPAGIDITFDVTAATTHLIELAARADGVVTAVRVEPGQHVRPGDVAIELDPGDTPARVDAAVVALAAAEHELADAGSELQRDEAFLKMLDDPEYLRKLDEPNRSELRFAEAQAQVARDERDRFAKLVEVGEVDLRRELASATAAVAVAEARVRELEKPRDHHAIVEYATSHARVLRTEVELATGRRDDAARALADARRALDACRVYATASGVIDEVLVTPGRVVSRDEPVARMSTWTEAPAPDAR